MATSVIKKPMPSYIDLGNQESPSAAWDAINIYDQTVIGHFTSVGKWMFVAYKYSDSLYGMMWTQKFNDWEMTLISVNNGNKTVKKVALQ